MSRWFSHDEGRRRSPIPAVLGALAALGGLWFARVRLPVERARPSVDGAAYLRHVAPALRSAGCATASCHGRVGATLHLAPALGDAAEAVREFHDVRARVTAGDAAGSVMWRRATGGDGHPAALAAGSCEAAVLRSWIEGRPTRGCAGR